MGYKTVNESPEAIELSYEMSTTPVSASGMKPTSTIVVDSTKANPEKLKALEDILYGSDETDARLPLPDEIASIMKDDASTSETHPSGDDSGSGSSTKNPDETPAG